ncbi:MAG: hypothetical protein ABL893_04590 [Hyphomicrobium sp.]
MKSTLKAMFGTLCPWGKFWLYLGLAALAAAAWMSFAVGWKMTTAHALFLAILSFVTAFLPMAAEKVWSEGRKGIALALAALSLPLFAIEFGQHAAYTAGIRGHDLTTAKVQNTKWADGRGDVEEARKTLALFEKRLADLQGENKWATTVTADALRAKLAGLNLAIDQEAARGGCKTKCLERTKERDDAASRIAILERVDDVTAKITATKAVIASAREKSATIEHKSSQTEHMNAFLSKAVALVGQGTLKPTDFTEESTQLSANLAMALAGTGLPALALFVAGLYRRKEDEDPTPANASRETPRPIGPTPTVHFIDQIKDDGMLQAIAKLRQLKAA